MSITKGSLQSYSALIRISFYARGFFNFDKRADGPLATMVVAGFAQLYVKHNPEFSIVDVKPAEVFTGSHLARTVVNPYNDGHQEILLRLAASQGTDVVTLSVRTQPELLRKVEVSVIKPIRANLRLGSTVPRLPPHDPITPLPGIYPGKCQSQRRNIWLNIDAGGYLVRRTPMDECTGNVESVYQGNPQKVHRCLLPSGQLTVTVLNGAITTTVPFEKAEGTFSLFDRTVQIMDQSLADGIRLEGSFEAHNRYESNTSGSLPDDDRFSHMQTRRIHFRQDGRFSRDEKGFSICSHKGDPNPQELNWYGAGHMPVSNTWGVWAPTRSRKICCS